MNNELIVSKEKFDERTKEDHPFLSDTYNMDLEFECGCGSSHLIDGDDVFLVKQTDIFEFVVQCPNDYKTLVEHDIAGRGHYSIMSFNTKESV